MTTYVASDDSEHVKAFNILVIELLCMLQKNNQVRECGLTSILSYEKSFLIWNILTQIYLKYFRNDDIQLTIFLK